MPAVSTRDSFKHDQWPPKSIDQYYSFVPEFTVSADHANFNSWMTWNIELKSTDSSWKFWAENASNYHTLFSIHELVPFNSLWPGDTIWHYTSSGNPDSSNNCLASIHYLNKADLSTEPSGTNFHEIWIKYFHSKKFTWKCCQQYAGHFKAQVSIN